MTFMVKLPLWLSKGLIEGKNMNFMVAKPLWLLKGRIEGKNITLMVTIPFWLSKGHRRYAYDLYGQWSHYFFGC